MSVGCDGDVIAVLNPRGVISRYSAETGAFIGQNQPSGGPLTDVQVSGGVMVVRSLRPKIRLYSLVTSSLSGSGGFGDEVMICIENARKCDDPATRYYNPQEAFVWYLKAAKLRSSYAQYAVPTCYGW